MEEMAKKRVKDSETEQSYLLMHRHINGYGRLFGGQLVAWIDELAGLVGRRHCGHEITTACIDLLVTSPIPAEPVNFSLFASLLVMFSTEAIRPPYWLGILLL